MRAFVVLCALIAYAIAAATDTTTSTSTTITRSAELFSIDLYRIIARNENRNLITSPLSAYLAMAMIASGARENTASEIRNILRLSDDDTRMRTEFRNIIDSFDRVKGVELKLANKVFVNKNTQIRTEFEEITRDNFRSVAEAVDFGRATEAASTINSWLEKHTNNRIKDLVKSADLNANTHMVLANALYFRGQWLQKFEASQTTERLFHINDQTTKNVPTMYQRNTLIYGAVPKLKAQFIEIPYNGEEVSLVIFIPDEINGLRELEEKLETISIESLRSLGTPHDVELYLPRFTVENSVDLNIPLREMGIEEIFTERANFEGISNRRIRLSKVVQKIFLDVNEEGSEAASSTALEFTKKLGRLDHKIVSVDRPFLTILKHKIVGPLFIGHVNEPIVSTM